jgi:hypothetical protein
MVLPHLLAGNVHLNLHSLTLLLPALQAPNNPITTSGIGALAMAVRHRGPTGDIPEAPAPWTTKNEAYWLISHLRSPLPEDIYDPLEAQSPACSAAEGQGGLTLIQIVRYSSTPVGSYDELLILPGYFKVKGGKHDGKSRFRVSRIYVSQKETTYNGMPLLLSGARLGPKLICCLGRKNWNIPKHLARFEFSSPPVGEKDWPAEGLKVSVYPVGSDASSQTVKPFFSVVLSPIRYTPSFPFSTKWLPMNLTMVQPPIPAGQEGYLCGTGTWKACDAVQHSSHAKLMSVQTSEDVDHKGHWPAVKPWSFGIGLLDATLEVTKPEEWTV